MKKIVPLFLAFLFLAMMLLTGIPAFAENAEEATPEAADVTSLIEQARTLMEAEDYEAACLSFGKPRGWATLRRRTGLATSIPTDGGLNRMLKKR